MNLLLDTHIVIAVLNETPEALPARIRQAILAQANPIISVVSLWEIAIKYRLGKLTLDVPLLNMPAILRAGGFGLLTVTEDHVLAELTDPPPTRDPFDRLLLAQCQVEGMRLVTLDRALAAHPLSLSPASAS